MITLWVMLTASADQCLCLAWEDDWQWSDCADGDDCPCACSDAVDHPTGTTFTSTQPTCSGDGLDEPPRTGAECVLRTSECVETDCDEGGCGCASPGSSGSVAPGVALLLLLRRRRS